MKEYRNRFYNRRKQSAQPKEGLGIDEMNM
jgi:hypothetical protein